MTADASYIVPSSVRVAGQVEPKKLETLSLSNMDSMFGNEPSSAAQIKLIRSRINIGTAVDNLKLVDSISLQPTL